MCFIQTMKSHSDSGIKKDDPVSTSDETEAYKRLSGHSNARDTS